LSQVILKSPHEKPIEALVLAALEAEKKEILTAILKTKEKLSLFEKRFNLSTADFLAKAYQEIPKITEMDAIEWSGEHETIKLLEERLSRLKEIQVCT
jgi:beta-glucosidase-like glycosyl hydrolase